VPAKLVPESTRIRRLVGSISGAREGAVGVFGGSCGSIATRAA
jgi:hypothetical protein